MGIIITNIIVEPGSSVSTVTMVGLESRGFAVWFSLWAKNSSDLQSSV